MADATVFMVDVLGTGEEPPGGDYAATIHASDADVATVRADDLGASRGDGVFETFGVVGGHPQSVDAHLARLANSAELLELPEPNVQQWRTAIEMAVATLPADVQCGLKLVLTRGIEGAAKPTGLVLATVTNNEFSERRAGIRVVTLDRGYASDVAARAPWLLAGAKTLSYAVNMAAIREAKRRGADDAIFVSSDGFVMEAPTSTVIVRTGNRFVTPRTDIGTLPGTSQLALFDFYRSAGFDAAEEHIPVGSLATADALWLVSSVRLAAPVVELNGKRIGHDIEMSERMNAALLSRDA